MIVERVAVPIGVDLQVAAHKIASTATDMVARELNRAISKTERSAAQYVLFSFGGNGGLLGLEAAKKAGINKAYFFSYGSVLSAFGSSVADVSHTYEHSAAIPITQTAHVEQALEWMREEARLDMEGEGFDLAGVSAELELVLFDERNREKVLSITHPWDIGENPDGKTIKSCLDESNLGATPEQWCIDIVRLRVSAPLSKLDPSSWADQGEDASGALKGERDVWRGTEKVSFKIYDWDRLNTGNIVVGPAIIESVDTNYVVNRGWEFVMDRYRNGVLTRRA